MQETENRIPKRSEWDFAYSSYFWNINLDLNHPANRTARLVGYSKKTNQQEAQDKDNLLKRKIINLYSNGYFKRSTSIEIYQRVDAIIDKKRDPQILVLYPGHFIIPEAAGNYGVIHKRFGKWLGDFYEAIRANQDVKKLLPPGRKPISNDDFLDVTKVRELASPAHLYQYVTALYRNGHPSGAIENFIVKYKTLKGW